MVSWKQRKEGRRKRASSHWMSSTSPLDNEIASQALVGTQKVEPLSSGLPFESQLSQFLSPPLKSRFSSPSLPSTLLEPTLHLDSAAPTPSLDPAGRIDPSTNFLFPLALSPLSIPSEGLPLSLVGLGVRTVSFLSVKVYSVGFYTNCRMLGGVKGVSVQRRTRFGKMRSER